MSKGIVCVFDLDGTLYPQNSLAIVNMRKKIVETIAQNYYISIDDAKRVYKSLPLAYPNPYDGFQSVGISPEMYQSFFVNIQGWKYINPDPILKMLFKHLSSLVDILIVSLAPQKHVSNMIKAIGIDEYVLKTYSVSKDTKYKKDELYKQIAKKYHIRYAIGDSYENDLKPAIGYGYDSFLVNNLSTKENIYNIIRTIITLTDRECNYFIEQ